jgi:hypothetical protein
MILKLALTPLFKPLIWINVGPSKSSTFSHAFSTSFIPDSQLMQPNLASYETIAINELLFDRASRFPFAAWAAREAGKLQVPCTRQCAYEDLRTTLRCGPNSLTGA